MSIITIERKILEKNDEVASQNRDLFLRHGIFSVNIVSSPGSGKTTILERTLARLRNKINVVVIEGDVQTDLDAQRVSALGVPAVQIVTKGGCHLEAPLVREALDSVDLTGVQLLIIENVGNLVCPANYDLGESMKVVVASVTEGDDKPLKYPTMFRNASVLIINKIDLLPYVNCRIDTLKRNALSVNPLLKVFEVSCTTNAGVTEWCDWLEQNTPKRR
ncbi:MAG: hydrogenase nickel incorporation protein HypB [Bacteroidota bacterium]